MSQVDHRKTAHAQPSKILARHHYSARTLSVFQIIAHFFTDIYYNHLYVEAQKARAEGKWETVTLSYKHACNAFLTAIDYTSKKYYKIENYTELLVGITEHFKQHTSFKTISISECINKIVHEFVPEDLFPNMDIDTRRNIIRNVLTSLIRRITVCIAQDFLADIIDQHEREENAQVILERFVDLCIYERELMYQKFTHGVAKPEQSLAERWQAENKKLKSELLACKNRSDAIFADLKTKTDQLAELAGLHDKLTERHRQLIQQLAEVKSQLVSEPQKYDARISQADARATRAESRVSDLEMQISRLNAQIERQQAQHQHQQARHQHQEDDSPFISDPSDLAGDPVIKPGNESVNEPIAINESVAAAIKRAESIKNDTRASFFSEKPKRSGRRIIKQQDEEELLN
jgi:hypothetical protein